MKNNKFFLVFTSLAISFLNSQKVPIAELDVEYYLPSIKVNTLINYYFKGETITTIANKESSSYLFLRSYQKAVVPIKKIFGGIEFTNFLGGLLNPSLFNLIVHGNSYYLGKTIPNSYINLVKFSSQSFVLGFSSELSNLFLTFSLQIGRIYNYTKANGYLLDVTFSKEGDTLHGVISAILLLQNSKGYSSTINASFYYRLQDSSLIKFEIKNAGLYYIPSIIKYKISGAGSFSGVFIPPESFYTTPGKINFVDSIPWKISTDTLKHSFLYSPIFFKLQYETKIASKFLLDFEIGSWINGGKPPYASPFLIYNPKENIKWHIAPYIDTEKNIGGNIGITKQIKKITLYFGIYSFNYLYSGGINLKMLL